jgi:hypothetical protein
MGAIPLTTQHSIRSPVPTLGFFVSYKARDCLQTMETRFISLEVTKPEAASSTTHLHGAELLSRCHQLCSHSTMSLKVHYRVHKSSPQVHVLTRSIIHPYHPSYYYAPIGKCITVLARSIAGPHREANDPSRQHHAIVSIGSILILPCIYI